MIETNFIGYKCKKSETKESNGRFFYFYLTAIVVRHFPENLRNRPFRKKSCKA